jgi:hypothetical protein
MPPTGAETGLIKAVISAFIKPFEIVITPVAERVASWLKRKPRLHVHFHPLTSFWCIANEKVEPVMQLVFTADFTHDGPKESLIILNAYGTRSQFRTGRGPSRVARLARSTARSRNEPVSPRSP